MGIIDETWTTGKDVQITVQRARGLRRLTGLIGRRPPQPGTALLLPRCRAVHGCGLRSAIDVVFISCEGTVVRTHRLPPFGFAASRAARDTFELAAGEAARLGLERGAHIAPAHIARAHIARARRDRA